MAAVALRENLKLIARCASGAHDVQPTLDEPAGINEEASGNRCPYNYPSRSVRSGLAGALERGATSL